MELSTATSDWQHEWSMTTKDIHSNMSYQESSERLRQLIKTGLLRFTDMRDNPDNFFAAHRLLVDPTNRGPGFWIRFTVQYNLFAGTVLGLGTPEQVAELDEMQARGTLGCFGLTEKLAGVNSGLVVNTTATWIPERQVFVLHSPNEGAYKNWISQGLTAEKCAVIADLRVDGKSYGPHGFLMDLRSPAGVIAEGVTLGDMGRKTTGNDLDNAWISFDNVVLPRTALLRRFADIQDNKYVQTTTERMRLEVIGQRLLTGRVAVAQAAVRFGQLLYANTRAYSEAKKCWAPGAEPKLSQIPQLQSLFREAGGKFERLDHFLGMVQSHLSADLKQNAIPSNELVRAIAVGKVRAVETSIALCFRLKQEVGSYALMGDTGFEHTDFLQCCKFAEGDSRILMQKMARDRMKEYNKSSAEALKVDNLENQLCWQLDQDIKAAAKAGINQSQAWDNSWETVYKVAEAVMDRVMGEWSSPKSKL